MLNIFTAITATLLLCSLSLNVAVITGVVNIPTVQFSPIQPSAQEIAADPRPKNLDELIAQIDADLSN